ncbi:MAG: hypothetical protein ACYC0V_17455 [Armatimonadota bacterium]
MKKSVSPGMVVLIIAVLVIVIGLVFMKGGSGGKKAVDIEKQIEASRTSVNGKMPTTTAPATE